MTDKVIGGVHDAAVALLRMAEVSAEDRRRAALAVCSRSADAADARELLLMLGLVGEASERADEVDEAPAESEPAAETKPARRPRAVRNGVHGHPIGLSEHVRRGEALCPPCADLWDQLAAAGVVRAVSP